MIDVPLNSEVMEQLALEAQLRGMTIGETGAALLTQRPSRDSLNPNAPPPDLEKGQVH